MTVRKPLLIPALRLEQTSQRETANRIGRLICTVHPIAMVAVFGLLSTLAAADSPTSPLLEPEIVQPQGSAWDWRGFYLGGGVGYAFGGDDKVGHRNASGTLIARAGTLHPGGLEYDIRLGWRNYYALSQRDWIYGFELGFSPSNIQDSTQSSTSTSRVEIDDVLSFRLKSGLSNRKKDTWFYGTLGFAEARISYATSGIFAGGRIDVANRSNRNGYVVGLGVERLLDDKFSLTIDYNFTQFGSNSLRDSEGSSTRATPKYSTVKLGLNYSF